MILLIILFFYPTLGVVKFGLAQVVNFRLSFRATVKINDDRTS
jgi:hypothetical protein